MAKLRDRLTSFILRVWSGKWVALAAALSGVLVFLSFPNWNLFPLAFLAFVPLWYVSSTHGSAWRAALLGWITGFVTNLGGFYWVVGLLVEFAGMPTWLCVLLYSLLCVQQGATFAFANAAGRWFQRRGVAPLLAFPMTFVVTESFWPMIFKWYIGNSQYQNLMLAQSAELGGPTLVSALVLTGNAALLSGLWLFRDARAADATGVPDSKFRRRFMLTATSLLLVFHLWGAWRMSVFDAAQGAAPTLRIGLVEANIGMHEKADPELARNNLLIHQRLSAQLAEQGAELILWPETAYFPERAFASTDPEVQNLAEATRSARLWSWLPRETSWVPPSQVPLAESDDADLRAGTRTADRVALQRGFSVPMLVGVVMLRTLTEAERLAAPPRRSGQARTTVVHNSAMLVDAEGRVLDVYDKNILMPFSEQVPGGAWLWHNWGLNVYALIPQSGDMHQGAPEPPMELPNPDGGEPFRLSAIICYEDIAPSIGRELHAMGAPDVILNVTNDAWFGKSAEPYLHMALSTFRAIEQRTWLVRSTNTGVSCMIDANGRIVQQTSLEGAETLIHDVPMLRATTTLYMRMGEWVRWALWGYLAVIWFITRAGRRSGAGGKSFSGQSDNTAATDQTP